MVAPKQFEGSDSETVFKAVTAAVGSPDTASLWERMLSEIRDEDVSAAISYLESEFQKIKQDLMDEIKRLPSD
jgi:hypothetical protein